MSTCWTSRRADGLVRIRAERSLDRSRFDFRKTACSKDNRLKILLALVTCLGLAACANADGSRPRMSADPSASPTGFTGGYAGANGGFGNLATKSAPF